MYFFNAECIGCSCEANGSGSVGEVELKEGAPEKTSGVRIVDFYSRLEINNHDCFAWIVSAFLDPSRNASKIHIYIDVHGHVYGCGTTSLCQPNPANEGAMLFGETCLFAALGFMVL